MPLRWKRRSSKWAYYLQKLFPWDHVPADTLGDEQMEWEGLAHKKKIVFQKQDFSCQQQLLLTLAFDVKLQLRNHMANNDLNKSKLEDYLEK